VIEKENEMEKITVTVCTGTCCFVMGGSELLLLEEHLPESLKNRVRIDWAVCMDACMETQGKPPFVKINGDLFPGATVQGVLARLSALTGDGAGAKA